MSTSVSEGLPYEQELALRDGKIDHLQDQIHQLMQAVTNLNHNQNSVPPPPTLPPLPPPLPPTRPNLNLPQPPFYSGNALDLTTFKIKLSQYLLGNFNTFFDDGSKLLYAGGLLQGPAQQWYETQNCRTLLYDSADYTSPSISFPGSGATRL